jgi:hypothetical protein
MSREGSSRRLDRLTVAGDQGERSRQFVVAEYLNPVPSVDEPAAGDPRVLLGVHTVWGPPREDRPFGGDDHVSGFPSGFGWGKNLDGSDESVLGFREHPAWADLCGPHE